MSLIMAIAMMFLIVIVVVGVMYAFTSRIQRDVQEGGKEQTDIYVERTATAIAVEGARGNQIYVRNSGKGTLRNFTVYVNGEIMVLDPHRSSTYLKEGETGTLVMTMRAVVEPDVIKVVSNFGARDSYVVRREEEGPSVDNPEVFDIPIVPRLWNISIMPGETFVVTADMDARASRSPIMETVLEVELPDGTIDEGTVGRLINGTAFLGTWEWVFDNTALEGQYRFTVFATNAVNTRAIVEKPQDTLEGFAYDWWNPSWRTRKAIVLSATRNFWSPVSHPRTNEPVWLTLDGMTIASGTCSQNLRLISPAGEQMAFQIYDGGSDPSSGRCEIITQFNGSRDDYDNILAYAYFNPGSALSPPVYPSDLTSSGNCYENSRLKLCLGTGDEAAITYIGTDVVGKEINLLSERERDDKYYSLGVQPSMHYWEGFDTYWCTNYTVDSGPTLLSNGPVAKVVRYDFSTVCEGTTYSYRYVLYFYSYLDWYEIDVLNLNNISFFKDATGKSLFVKTKWDKDLVELVPNEGWCTARKCSYWGTANGTDLGVGVVTKFCSHTEEASRLHYVLSLIPTNAADVSDKVEMEPGRLTTRTVFTSGGAITERNEKMSEMTRSPIEPRCDGSSQIFLTFEENN